LLSSKARYSPYAPPPKGPTGALNKPGVAVKGAGKGKESGTIGKCVFCKSTVARPEAMYCQGEFPKSFDLARDFKLMYHSTTGCAYKKGICSMCAKPILDTSQYKMSSK
jgi:hypothetical protein